MHCFNDRPLNPRWFPYFAGFTAFTPEIPKLYWDVKSSEQRYFVLCETLHKLVCYADAMSDEINITHEELEEFRQFIEDFKEHGFEEFFEDKLLDWLDAHKAEIWEHLGKMVFFGLTMDGYFCAYVPDSWSDIEFDTGSVYGTYQYGRLILRYNVDGSGVIDNTGTGSAGDVSTLIAQINDLEKRVKTNENTLYTALQKGEIG